MLAPLLALAMLLQGGAQAPDNSQQRVTMKAPALQLACPSQSVKAEQGTKSKLPDPNWLLVFVGVGTAGVIGWQSWETRKAASASLKQVRLTRQGMINQFRPRIHIRKMILVWDGEKQSPVRVAIFFVNLGESDANVLGGEIRLNTIFGSNPHERSWAVHVAIKDFMMLPGLTSDAGIDAGGLGTFCEMVQLEADRNGLQESWLECTGKIEYLDENGTKRTTGFCRRYDVALHKFIVMEAEEDYED